MRNEFPLALGALLMLGLGCVAPKPAPTKEVPPPAVPVLVQVYAAEEKHDLDGLLRLRQAAASDPKAAAELAVAIYWVANVAEAKEDLASACRDERLPADSSERIRACATLRFNDLAPGQSFNHLRSGGQGPLLEKVGLLLAMVSVNGLPPEPFIVDTGAPTTVISRRFADRVKLAYPTDIAAQSHDGAGIAVKLFPAVLSSLKWGEIEVENVPAHVLELPENFKIGGILSPQDMLRGMAFEVDGPGHQVRTLDTQQAAAWAAGAGHPVHEVPLRWAGGNLLVDSRANELVSLPFLLDSGAGHSGLCEEALRAQGASLDGGVEASSATAAGHSQVRSGISGTLRVGDEPAHPTSLFVTACPGDGSAQLSKSGYVGRTWFSERRVYFPSDRRRLLFTEPY
jgi:hypothetical protein